MEKIYEVDLYPPIKKYLEKNGYKVCGEINHCDIAALKDDKLIIIELKKSLNLDLLIQAVKRQKISDLVYIAIPKPKFSKKLSDLVYLVKRLELGLIYVSINTSKIEIVLDPVPFDRLKSMQINKKKKEKLVSELLSRNVDDNIGGSKGKKLMTAYKDQSLFIACCLELYGPLSPKQLRQYGSNENKTQSILAKNFYGWFYRVENGIYSLTDIGREAIYAHQQLSELHKKQLTEKE